LRVEVEIRPPGPAACAAPDARLQTPDSLQPSAIDERLRVERTVNCEPQTVNIEPGAIHQECPCSIVNC
jgi:hypothetical protein